MDQLKIIFDQVSDSKHSAYGNFLSLQAMTDLIGVTSAELKQAKQWLQDQGAENVTLSAGRTHLSAWLPKEEAYKLHAAGYNHAGPAVIRYGWALGPAQPSTTSSQPSTADGTRPLSRKEYLAQAAKQLRNTGQVGESDPNGLKVAMGVPTIVIAKSPANSQMVWGTGTFGVQFADLDYFWSLWDIKGTSAKTMTYEGKMGSRGDNYKEGCLDSEYITGTGNGVPTTVSNTNTSVDAEEGLGYGWSLLTFASDLTNRPTVPNVLSLSIGSLSYASCDMLCNLIKAEHSYDSCWTYLTKTQRQVCMFASAAQTDGINSAFMKLGVRGMSIFAASGDGGSHWAFGPFSTDAIGQALNKVTCEYNWPVFPADSPYVTAVGGTDNVNKQTPWVASGGGFSWTQQRPSWQQNQVTAYLSKATGNLIWPPATAMNVSNRGYPDVAAYAGEVPYIEQESPGGVMGTSVSAPVFAGVISLINDLRLQNNLKPLGFLNPRIYQLASEHPEEAFQGMDQGSSRCDAGGDCCAKGYPVLPGWNPVTGLGWPKWAGLSKYLVAAP